MSTPATNLKELHDTPTYDPKPYTWSCAENIADGSICTPSSTAPISFSLGKGALSKLPEKEPKMLETFKMFGVSPPRNILTVYNTPLSARDFCSIWISRKMDVFDFRFATHLNNNSNANMQKLKTALEALLKNNAKVEMFDGGPNSGGPHNVQITILNNDAKRYMVEGKDLYLAIMECAEKTIGFDFPSLLKATCSKMIINRIAPGLDLERLDISTDSKAMVDTKALVESTNAAAQPVMNSAAGLAASAASASSVSSAADTTKHGQNAASSSAASSYKPYLYCLIQ